MNKKNDAMKTTKLFVPYLLLFIFVIGTLYYVQMKKNVVNELKYNEFYTNLVDGKVKTLTITPSSQAEVFELTGELKDYKDGETYKVSAPLADSVIEELLKLSNTNGVEVVVKTNKSTSAWITVIINVVPFALLILMAAWLMAKLGNGNKQSMDFGRSKARLSDENNKKTFKDVAGLKEEKEEVKELIDFLKNPKKFQKLGARIPKGVLLVGPPGTGKTLLARAVAGEAKVPFYYISGSDFVELFVGVGASRVRDMFKQAKQTAPCLIFIDEIDAVGRQRGTGLGGGHDEREQTLNQLLTEMDGFGANEGIIIIAATNRPDVLDPALLRPGRFDRQVTVSLPDINEREEILKVHARNKIFDKEVNLKYIASRTVGFSGADLENLLNEAALLAVRRNKDAITMSEIDEGHDRVIMGPAKVSRKYTDHEKRVVAYHEAGHAVVGIKLEGANEVQKVTIIPRGAAGGYNLMLPKEETFLQTKKELLETISGLLGGRVSEELTFHEVTTGAHNDFEKATKIARAMVTEYGMSDLGPVQFEHQESSVFLGRDYNKSSSFSNAVADEIDKEVRKIIDEQYKVTKKILEENSDLVKLIAESLLKYETITKEQIEYLVENGHMKEDEVEEDETDILTPEDFDNVESDSSDTKKKNNKKKHSNNKGEE